jgi:hypothetical protein
VEEPWLINIDDDTIYDLIRLLLLCVRVWVKKGKKNRNIILFAVQA